MIGALLGAGLIVFTRDWVAGSWPGHGPLLLGALFIAAVYLLPRGLAGLRGGPGRSGRAPDGPRTATTASASTPTPAGKASP